MAASTRRAIAGRQTIEPVLRGCAALTVTFARWSTPACTLRRRAAHGASCRSSSSPGKSCEPRAGPGTTASGPAAAASCAPGVRRRGPSHAGGARQAGPEPGTGEHHPGRPKRRVRPAERATARGRHQGSAWHPAPRADVFAGRRAHGAPEQASGASVRGERCGGGRPTCTTRRRARCGRLRSGTAGSLERVKVDGAAIGPRTVWASQRHGVEVQVATSGWPAALGRTRERDEAGCRPLPSAAVALAHRGDIRHAERPLAPPHPQPGAEPGCRRRRHYYRQLPPPAACLSPPRIHRRVIKQALKPSPRAPYAAACGTSLLVTVRLLHPDFP